MHNYIFKPSHNLKKELNENNLANKISVKHCIQKVLYSVITCTVELWYPEH